MKNTNNLMTQSLRDQVVDIIRGMIMDGELTSGQKINEREISSKLGISTTPIKEAFRTLQADGLIIVKPRSGTYVADFSRESLMQLMFLRSSVEGVGARFAAEHAKAKEITSMQLLLDEIALLLETEGNDELIIKKNSKFHEILHSSSGNDFVLRIIANVSSVESALRRLNVHDKDRAIECLKEHQFILNAIKAKNADKAEELMIKHIRSSAKFIVSKK
ncbi:GntR family transcriptional regulator [Clostridium sp. DL1XJH146]